MAATPCVVGIDVATAQLDMALRPTVERWAVTHDDTEMAALVARRQAVPTTRMVLEATVGDQWAVVAVRAEETPSHSLAGTAMAMAIHTRRPTRQVWPHWLQR